MRRRDDLGLGLMPENAAWTIYGPPKTPTTMTPCAISRGTIEPIQHRPKCHQKHCAPKAATISMERKLIRSTYTAASAEHRRR